MRDQLDERGRRLYAAAEVRAAGYGGVAAVARATGLARSTIGRGMKDLDRAPLPRGRVRREGGGRRPLSDSDPTLLDDLRRLVEPVTLGDPMRPLLWVSKSHEKLAAALRAHGPHGQREHGAQAAAPARLSPPGQPQGQRGPPASRPRRPVRAHQRPGRRLPGRRSAGDLGRHQEEGVDRQLQQRRHRLSAGEGQPRRINVHDFENKDLGKVVPYGVYDLADDSGWVSVGITSDTAQFAVNAIRCWLEKMGRERYPAASRLMITADCGGSNGARVRLWKRELQKLADETGLSITVCHYPPGTSKWNKIEHRLFCHITQNWRAAADQPPGRRRTDRRHDHDNRAHCRLRAGHQHLREGHQGHRGRNGHPQPTPRCLPSGMELHHRTTATNLTRLFLRVPLRKSTRTDGG